MIRRFAMWASLVMASAVLATEVYSFACSAAISGPTYMGVPLKRTFAVRRGDLFYVTNDDFDDGFGNYRTNTWPGLFSVQTCYHYMDGTTCAYRINLVIPLLVGLAYPAVWLAGWSRRRFKSRCAGGLCVHCGYNLTGNTSGVCPECGEALPMQTFLKAGGG